MANAFLHMARNDARTIIPADEVCRDFFSHLTYDKFVRRACTGEIDRPIVRMDVKSQKRARGVELVQLARFIDERYAAALDEHKALTEARRGRHTS